MRNVTAILMGDPAARFVRVPTPDDIARTRLADLQPVRKAGAPPSRPYTPLSAAVRAMKPGDRLAMPRLPVGKGFQQEMARAYGWTMSCRQVRLADGAVSIELTRLT